MGSALDEGNIEKPGGSQAESQQVPGGNQTASTAPEVRPVLSLFLWKGQPAQGGATCCHRPRPMRTDGSTEAKCTPGPDCPAHGHPLAAAGVPSVPGPQPGSESCPHQDSQW